MLALHFPRGLPGFEGHQRFTLTATEPPLATLVSAEADGPCFHAIPVAVVDPHYHIGITMEDLRLLGFDDTQPAAEDFLCLAILSFDEGGATANLLAPVVVNVRTGVGVQAVREDARYSHRHRLGAQAAETAECS